MICQEHKYIFVVWLGVENQMNGFIIILGLLGVCISVIFIFLIIIRKIKLPFYHPLKAIGFGIITLFMITPGITELSFYFHSPFVVISASFGIGAFLGGFITVLLSNKNNPLIGIVPTIPYIIGVLIVIGPVEAATNLIFINIIFALLGGYIGEKTKKIII